MLIADLFHPIDGLAIELFLNSDVGHGRSRGGTVPMLFVWRNPGHVTR